MYDICMWRRISGRQSSETIVCASSDPVMKPKWKRNTNTCTLTIKIVVTVITHESSFSLQLPYQEEWLLWIHTHGSSVARTVLSQWGLLHKVILQTSFN